MFKKLIYFAVSVIMILCTAACSSEDDALSAISAESKKQLYIQWLTLPEESKDIKVVNTVPSSVQISFKGCGYKEINAFAKTVEDALKSKGYQLYTPIYDKAMLATDIVAATDITAVVEDESFSGEAYGFLYKAEGRFIELKISYYGSAGGEYGNGLCKVHIFDSSDYYARFDKEIGNEE